MRQAGRGRNVTGEEYVRAITAKDSDRRAREAFRQRALALTAPSALIYDFGAGPGLDARFYAGQGRRVEAYDIDPQMCQYCGEYCAAEIAAGSIVLHPSDYGAFLARGAPDPARRASLITANFAPLNLVEELPPLFAAFAALTAPDGLVLASVLSPYFYGDLRYGWFWRNLPQLIVRGRFAVPGAQARIWRRRLPDFAALCAPHFTLERVFRGDFDARGNADARGAAAGSSLAALHVSRCRFMLLLFRRRASAA